jgi:dolichol-phosphate mannosyltransferase
MDNKDVWAVLPAYNERNVGPLLENISRYLKNIILVDDGSDPGLYDDLHKSLKGEFNLVLLTHKKNHGKGAALRTGCDYAFQKTKAKAVLLIDSDGQHDPSLIPDFLDKLDDHDLVLGSRALKHPMPLMTKLGNRAISFMTSILFWIKVSDVLSGYRALTKRAYVQTRWSSRGFDVEADIIISAAKRKLSCCEITIPTIYMRRGNINYKEGFRIVRHILARRLL